MASPDFDVVISGGHISHEAWLRSSGSEKPRLTEEQKEAARKRGMSEEEYARVAAAQSLAEETLRGRGRILGERIQEILRDLGPEYSLDAVIRQGTELRWLARVQAADKTLSVALPIDLVDDVIDSGSAQDVNRLRNLLLFGVGRQELILKH